MLCSLLGLALFTLHNSLQTEADCCMLLPLSSSRSGVYAAKRIPGNFVLCFSLGSYFLAYLLPFLHVSESFVFVLYIIKCPGFLVVLSVPSQSRGQ